MQFHDFTSTYFSLGGFDTDFGSYCHICSKKIVEFTHFAFFFDENGLSLSLGLSLEGVEQSISQLYLSI